MISSKNDNSHLEERVLAFMGAFSQVQLAIDTALDLYIRKQMPSLGSLLKTYYVARIRDDQRLPCFVAMATDTGYSGDLAQAKFIYERAKQTRDFVGHSQSVALAWHPTHQDWLVGISHRRGIKHPAIPDMLKPVTFERLKNDCDWLAAHVWRAVYEANVTKFQTFEGEPAEPPVPPNMPLAGEPLPSTQKVKIKKEVKRKRSEH